MSKQSFPSDYELDGEFFTGRGDFRTTVSIVKTKLKIDDEKWKTVKFHIFDAPNIKGTFEDRINIIGEYFVQNRWVMEIIFSLAQILKAEEV